MHSLARAELSGSITGTTDYIGYGYSKSDGDPAIQTYLDYEHPSGLFLGVFTSSVNFSDRNRSDHSSVEITPYLGWHFELTQDWRAQVQWQRFLYDDKIFGTDADYNLFSSSFHYQDILSVTFAISDDLYQQDEIATYFQLSGRYPVTDSIEASTNVGYSLTKKSLEYDYVFWNAGFTWFHPYGSLDFRYVQSKFVNSTAENTLWPFDPHEIDAKFVFTISFGF